MIIMDRPRSLYVTDKNHTTETEKERDFKQNATFTLRQEETLAHFLSNTLNTQALKKT